MTTTEKRLHWAWRLVIALACGVVAAAGTRSEMKRLDKEEGYDHRGRDFTFFWRGARAVVEGKNPYEVITPTGRPPYHGYFTYPLPAALVTTPLARLSARDGAAIFVGCGFALAAFGLMSLATWRLATLMSGPALWTMTNGQWSPLLLGATLLPWFGFLLTCKPTAGAALFLWKPNWKTFLGGVAACVIALLVLPTWPLDFLHVLKLNPWSAQYRAPLLMPGGGLVLALAFLRWRLPEGRLVAAMSCIPQNTFFYDQLPLMLVPNNMKGLLMFGIWSNLVRIAAQVFRPKWAILGVVNESRAWEPFILYGLYFPCLVMILLRPNEGAAPAWIERLVARAPRWLRGRAAPEAVAAPASAAVIADGAAPERA